MDAELQAWLFESTLAVTVALLLVLLLRRPVRALLGASACLERIAGGFTAPPLQS